jgi:hypothetical protein
LGSGVLIEFLLVALLLLLVLLPISAVEVFNGATVRFLFDVLIEFFFVVGLLVNLVSDLVFV